LRGKKNGNHHPFILKFGRLGGGEEGFPFHARNLPLNPGEKKEKGIPPQGTKGTQQTVVKVSSASRRKREKKKKACGSKRFVSGGRWPFPQREGEKRCNTKAKGLSEKAIAFTSDRKRERSDVSVLRRERVA